MLKRHIRALSALALVAAGFGAAASMREAVKPFTVYHDGDDLVFTPESAGTRKLAILGPWKLGERLGNEKPIDKHLNLYVVVPGAQYQAPDKPEYDHNLVINKYTVDGKARDWDVFWCLILDPKLHPDMRSERELLVAKHQTFRPGAVFEFKDIPSHVIMTERLGVKSMADLEQFRLKDNSLPRLLILPAHVAVRGTAEIPDVTITHPAADAPH
jgi:hypothetical protein